MLNRLTRYPQFIARLCMVLLYLELLTGALVTRAGYYYTLPISGYTGPVKGRQPLRNGALSGWPEKRTAGLRNTQPPAVAAAKQMILGTGGPTQPEMQAFGSVNANNMVDLFSGDFSYNIPLLDVGGYPLGLSYKSGISMDQEASWVGLGWNINPGNISRNLRGLPDDFDGDDSLRKVVSIKENKTIGVTAGANVEFTGYPANLGASQGVFHNNYKGWGIEHSVNASINSGTGSAGELTSGLSITNNSQDGLTIAPSLGIAFSQKDGEEKSGIGGSFSTTLPYNSRTGLKGLQLSAGIRQYDMSSSNTAANKSVANLLSDVGQFSTMISFASPTALPSISMPYTSSQFTFTGKLGTLGVTVHPTYFISGYVYKTKIAAADTAQSLPAYGYLYSQDATRTKNPLLDYNREKELVYRDKPAVPHIAVPFYTYDAFSITGEGTGGMFRAYRGDIGYVHDHFIRTKDATTGASIDVGLGNLVHAGVDVSLTRSFTQNSAWLDQNSMRDIVDFRNSDTSFEAVYFRNPGEKAINSSAFYNALGGDDVVTVGLYQPDRSSSSLQATNYLMRYRNKKPNGSSLLTPQNAVKPTRDKRSQVISYLTAQEADGAGLFKYIENYTPNQFGLSNCISTVSVAEGANGLAASYFSNGRLQGTPYNRIDDTINFNWKSSNPGNLFSPVLTQFPSDNFSIRWNGRLKAPVTGQYTFVTTRDNGVRLWLNDSLLINKWGDNGRVDDSVKVNLVAGQLYNFKMEYVEYLAFASIKLQWSYPGQSRQVIPAPFFYLPAQDVIPVNAGLKLERRVTPFRKKNHLSEIDVLNPDGKRYVYGIPVYNFRQKESSFSVNKSDANPVSGLVKYNHGVDNTTRNKKGQDNYYRSDETPAYAHSFLLSGILSPDYVDLTGNGISDDDLGDAVKFKYSKINGPDNPFRWRAPYTPDSVMYNERMKTDSRDDQGSYTYGEKELWFLHSIESKTMIATFVLESRLDLYPIDEAGRKYFDNSARRLKEINLYSKADLLKNPATAKPIKTVHFEYSYELCPGVNLPVTAAGKLTLKSVWFTYNGNAKAKQNPYVFNYTGNNPAYRLNSYDGWGNFKDPLQNPGSTPGKLLTNAEYPYALQDSALASQNAAAWTLDSIYLPSGGSIKVTYESDDYAYVQQRRAMGMLKLKGLGAAPGLANPSASLYGRSGDNLYVYVNVPAAVSNAQEVYRKYLAGVDKLFFKLFVQMPGDQYGQGAEYVSCYAKLDPAGGYGIVNGQPNTIWVKLSGISLPGNGAGDYSPLAKAAIQFLRLNLPSKAYPGSQVGDNLDLTAAVQLISSLAMNIVTAFQSFDNTARGAGWAARIDTSRSFVRLNVPGYQKFGGGHRVKRIKIYDNWNKMTGQRAVAYGQEYTYKTVKDIDGAATSISSGVASWEPGIIGDENPFRQPIEYVESISVLGPVSMGYSEEPLGESLFPAPQVGYSKVRVRTINYKNTRSANGYDETQFYTAYDFPVYTDRTLIDDNTKKRFKPAIANFLRINAKYYLATSQGFKVELNDMHGKLRSQASYAETDPNTPVTYTENIYRVENPQAEQKRLYNVVMAMRQDGMIDTAALIGKDVELMMDMREQQTITSANNISLNTDVFSMVLPPFFVIPSFFSLPQRQENKFRSIATTKVIQRYGIVDSVIHLDKGSKIATKDLVYDAETGEVLLSRTQNEFNDPVYNFNYPAYWAYNGMGPAYKNIAAVANHLFFSKGKITGGLSMPDTSLFTAGDELLVSGKPFTGTAGTCTPFATFANYNKIWAFDSALTGKGPSKLYFMDAAGKPYTGSDVGVKVIRSGRKNLNGSVGSVTLLSNPLRKNAFNQYQLLLDSSSKVVNASAAEFNNLWQVEARNAQRRITQVNCPARPFCYDTVAASVQGMTVSTCYSLAKNPSYSAAGAFVYADITNLSAAMPINDTTGFWENPGNLAQGRLNQCGIWMCGSCTGNVNSATCTPDNQWIGFNKSVFIPTSDTVFIGMAGDNDIVTRIDQKTSISLMSNNGSSNVPFIQWYVFPVYLTQGYHQFSVQGRNFGSAASFGMEVYQLPRSLLLVADSNIVKSHTLFSTATLANNRDSFPSGYSCPIGYTLDSTGGKYTCIKPVPCRCDTLVSLSCYNAVTDTTINPYTANITGNWKNYKSYVYYTNRAETDPAVRVNTRTGGTIKQFAPFWNFQSGGIRPVYDTTRWVWNTQTNFFNKKGFELENNDPLGRYNAGLYGYNNSLPTAAVQNAQYREVAFDGFEDYGYSTQGCDTACASPRHFDFSGYASALTTVQKHTGKYSLLVNAGGQASLRVKTVAQNGAAGALSVAMTTDACSGQPVVTGVRANTGLVQPLFSPFTGKQLLVSAWVKEGQGCNCATYTGNRISLVMSGAAPATNNLQPSGAIVEGWQRYEGVFTIPASDTVCTISLQATGTVPVYFDDIRLQPFNANMKCYVYNPLNLRLMAELDENNYATFYEYDDDGTLIRVKKETERGIQTIKETRSALLKQ